LGETGLESKVRSQEGAIEPAKARLIHLDNLGDLSIGIGSYGPYVRVEKDGVEIRASLPEEIPPADLSAEHIATLIKQKQEGPTPLGIHQETGLPIYVLTGRFGPYVQLGEVTPDNPKPKRASLPKGLKPEQVTVDVATQLLSLPRLLGSHPQTGKPIQAGLGRFGPYVVCDGDFRSLTGSDDLFSITLERALELLSQPKTRGRQAAKPIKDLGSHPVDQAPIQIFSGRYGPYVKHGDLNATIPKDRDPETLTLEEALSLLAAQAEKAPKAGKKKAEASTPARKTPAKATSKTTKAATQTTPPPATGATRAKTGKDTHQVKPAPESPVLTPEIPTPSRITIKNRGKTS